MKRSHALLLALCLLSSGPLAAQEPLDNYYPYNPSDYEEEYRPMLRPDSTLFYRGIALAEDLYGRNSDFRFPFVRYRRRGLPWDTEQTRLHGIELGYGHRTALGNLGAGEYRTSGLHMADAEGGSINGSREMRLPEEESAPWHRASATFAGRNYLFGARLAAGRALGNGWSGAASVHYRTGRDMHVEGVFTDALSVGVRAAKRFGEGHSLALLLIASPSMRGLRSSSTEEAFALTGDPLYNPAWGYQDGKVRNSRVRREFVPLPAAVNRRMHGTATRLEASLGAEYGCQSYSSLGWYNARTPQPDNYRYMPSYTGDRASEQAWRNNDPRYTQIDWDGLIARNRMADGEAVYALEDRVTRTARMQLDLRLTTEMDERLTLRYGLHIDLDNRRNYKRMRDLLGARYLTDIDQYLVDDDTYSNLLQNDLRHPNRRIGEGDRFGYDYALTTRSVRAHLDAEYRTDRLTARLHASLGHDTRFRRGYYEKELFAGRNSYGLSRESTFTPYLLKGQVGWAFSPRSYLEVVLATGARPPEAEALFLQPQYNNRRVNDIGEEHIHAAELNYRRMGRYLSFQATLYVVALLDGHTIVGYTTRNSGGVPENFRNYFVIRFDKPFTGIEMTDDPASYKPGTKILKPEAEKGVEGNHAVMKVHFTTERGEQVKYMIGTMIEIPRAAVTAASPWRAAARISCARSTRASTARCSSRASSMRSTPKATPSITAPTTGRCCPDTCIPIRASGIPSAASSRC